MINLSYRFDLNSSILEVHGIPDVSNADSEKTIGILSSWTLKIIGSPQLEGEKEHLDSLMQVILQYSRSYISGIRKTFKSKKSVVMISPFGNFHKLLLNSTKKDVKPLEIILDDSELSDLTQCLDNLRFDSKLNINWDINIDGPYTQSYIQSNQNKTNKRFTFMYAFVLFISTFSLMLLIPTNNKYEVNEPTNSSLNLSEEIN